MRKQWIHLALFLILFSLLANAETRKQPLKVLQPPAPTPIPVQSKVPAISLDELKGTQAVLETSLGEIVIEFYVEKAPQHCQYIASLIKTGFYDGTTFHQVLLGGFIQGGDPLTKDPSKKALYGTGGLNVLKAEINDAKHLRGTVSAILLPGNPNSAGSQFFICVVDQPQLDGKHTAWGHVVEGMDVVDKISSTPADSNMMAKERVEIHKAFLRPIPPPQPIPFDESTSEEMKKFHVVLETTMGNIEIEFYPNVAPEHVRNFLKLSMLGLYDTTIWHRVVPGFVIQGGDFSTRLSALSAPQMTKYVKNLMVELGDLKHEKGTVSMARGDALDSATTSFFICLGDLPTLDGKYTIFGKVVNGIEVVDKIAAVPVDDEKPRTRIEIIHAKVIKIK
jgi:cyclophilin family peptidyl-prolyl cis-trans isomerase